MDALARALAFHHGMQDRIATRAEHFAWGTALFNDEFPAVYANNLLRVEAPLAGVAAGEVAGEADRVQGPAGLRHRRIEISDDEDGERLRPGFQALGWGTEADVWMAWRRPPDRPAEVSATEMSWEEIRPAVDEAVRGHPSSISEEEARQLVERTHLVERATRLRLFGARAGGRVAGYCHLYSDGRTAQIEDVNTLRTYRGRGLARAVVLRALDEARRTGHDLVFLVADEHDWPRDLYGRLGFDPIGRTWTYTRTPRRDSQAT